MTQNNRVLLNVKRFRQKPSQCGLAAAASLANYYDRSITYSDVQDLVKPSNVQDGVYTSEQARLLNQLGFGSVSIVIADLHLIDLSMRAYYGRIRDKESREYADDMAKWLEDENCDNRLIIDYNFAKYIRRSLDNERPVGASISWTKMFRYRKGDRSDNGDIKGEPEEHAIVVRGYDSKGVFIVDSHWQCYTGKRKKYSRGYYKVSWDIFLVNMLSDIILIG